MTVLAIETSTPLERVAVVRDGEVVSELVREVGRGHTEVLLRAVESALRGASTSVRDLDAIAVSIGPGRFSGLRVGLATAKGLAAAGRVPIVPVPTLEALAESARPERGLVCPMLDARRGEVYAAVFRLDTSRERLLPDTAASPADVAARVRDVAGGADVLFVGNGATVSADVMRAALGARARFAREEIAAPAPRALAAMVQELGLLPPDAGTLEPVYLRGI